MSSDIDSIKRKLLIKYPSFGSTIAKLDFKEEKGIDTAGTDGKNVFYNPKFLEELSDKQKVFLFAHEVCHVKFDHIFRREGKDKKIWNEATDAVINALLQQDGLEMIEGGIDIPNAEKFSADDMYEKLLEEKKKQKEEQQNNQQGGEGQSGSQGQESNSQGQAGQEEQGKEDEQQEENQNVGHDSHDLWDKAIEERKKEQEKQDNKDQEQSDSQDKEEEDKKDKGQSDTGEKDKDKKGEGQQDSEKIDERKDFEKNKEERKKRLQDLSKELAKGAAGKEKSTGEKKLSDIGIARPLIDWRRLLKQATKYEEEWTRKNARMRGGYFRHRLEQIPVPESEIVLDVSGSVSEKLLKNFLRECKNIINDSRVKVGCFDTQFHGFTELKKPEDIDNMTFPIGGGTDFNVAVNAFSRRATNKIIFTDGEAYMPKKEVRGVIWVVFGDRKIHPKGGKVINIQGEQLRRLYQNFEKDNLNER